MPRFIDEQAKKVSVSYVCKMKPFCKIRLHLQQNWFLSFLYKYCIVQRFCPSLQRGSMVRWFRDTWHFEYPNFLSIAAARKLIKQSIQNKKEDPSDRRVFLFEASPLESRIIHNPSCIMRSPWRACGCSPSKSDHTGFPQWQCRRRSTSPSSTCLWHQR